MRTIIHCLLFLVLVSCTPRNDKSEAINLEETFLRPSDSARPWAYWYWMDANATAKGVERDLEDGSPH